MVYTRTVARVPKGWKQAGGDSSKMGRKGCNAEKDPRMYVGATPTLGLPLVPVGFGRRGQRAPTDRCCAHVTQGWTTVPGGAQLEADCFPSSLPLHVRGEQRSGRACRCWAAAVSGEEAFCSLLARSWRAELLDGIEAGYVTGPQAPRS